MNSGRTYKIAVLGSATETEDSLHARKAFKIGEAVARRGAILLTGGCPGLPHAAAMGSASAGGTTVAISPAMDWRTHSKVLGYPVNSQIILFTGMGSKGRNVILVRSADACIFVGGGMGTLNEFTIAYDELCPESAIGVLAGSGGFSDEYSRLADLVGHGSAARLLVHADPDMLVEKVFQHLGKSDQVP